MTTPPPHSPEVETKAQEVLPQHTADTHGSKARTRTLLLAGSLALLVGGCAAVTAAGFSRFTTWSELPTCESGTCPSLDRSLADFRPYQPPQLVDATGRLSAYLPGRVSSWVPLDRISPWVVNGVVATEDRRFRQHRGLDYRGAARAAMANLSAGSTQEGASTITMQLVRVLWAEGLEGYSKWQRKSVEVRTAKNLERLLTKDEILALYLNTIYMGEGVYGVQAASREYFGKDVADLDLAESAALVATIKTPAFYNPRREQGEERRMVVLTLMEREGVATPREVAEARTRAVETIDGTPRRQGRSYFASAVDRELRQLIPDPAMRSGVRVFTTQDPQVQRAADLQLHAQIERIESGEYGAFDPSAPGSEPDPLQGAVVVVDTESGAVRAVVGGRSFRDSQFDRALQARRQAGSVFKPFVYGAALESGAITLADRVDLSPIRMELDEDELWEPRDMVDDTIGMPIRHAMAHSSNTAAIRVGLAAGVQDIRSFARRTGLDSPIAPYPSSFIGASEVTPVDLAAAYATFGNGGYRVSPYLIERVESSSGEILYEHQAERRRALKPEVAYLVNSLLEDVVNRGTGYAVRRAGYQGRAAGKTGTTNGGRDAWFVGYAGTLSAAVWIGFDRPRTIARNASGTGFAAPVWGRLMEDVLSADDRQRIRVPEALTRITVDASLGVQVPEGCETTRETRTEFFLEGTEPLVYCPDLDRRAVDMDRIAAPVELEQMETSEKPGVVGATTGGVTPIGPVARGTGQKNQ